MMISAANLRRLVGTLGMLLPFVVAVAGLCPLQESISSYYYIDNITIGGAVTRWGARNEFVGILWVLSVFLLCYRGYEIRDFWLAKIAGVMAMLTALCPCAQNDSPSEILRGTFHLAFAGIFLACLALLILVEFTKTNPQAQPTPQKLQRNRVYYACGSLMTLCLVYLLGYKWLTRNDPTSASPWPVFILESVTVLAFGFAWLVKGDTLWRDKQN